MPEPQEARRGSVSPVKLVLAAVLSVTFVVVLIVQFGDASSTDKAGLRKGARTARVRSPRGGSAAETVEDPAGLDASERPALPWRIRKLADVLQHDPFKLPAEFSQYRDSAAATSKLGAREEAVRRQEELLRKRAQRDQALEELRKEGVKAVVGGGSSGNVAIVGSKTVRVGDELNGFRIIAIEADGVVLEEPPIE